MIFNWFFLGYECWGKLFGHPENISVDYSRWSVLCDMTLRTFGNAYGFEIRNRDAARVLNDRGQQELRSQAGKFGNFLKRQTQECQNPK